MDGEAVKEMATRFREPQMLDGFIVSPSDWVVKDPASLVTAGPMAKTLVVSTLGAVRDYVAANRDNLDMARLVVHVESPASVHLLGPLDVRSRTRESYVVANALDMTTGFIGKFMSLEDFNLGLQVRFADADDRKRVLALLGNVKHETIKTAVDDGVTQSVQARAGAVLVSEVAVPNPVTLCAFRSFRDIVQPSSIYVLRVQAGKAGGLPEAGLFEADGGTWRLTAVDRVRTWLMEALPATVSVLA